MATISNKNPSPKGKKSSSKSRPESTSQLNAPSGSGTSDAVEAAQAEALSSNVISGFSHDGKFFALLGQAIDRHRLRVFAVQRASEGSSSSSSTSSKLLADYVIPQQAKCNSLAWGRIPDAKAVGTPESKSKKRRKSKGAASSDQDDSAAASSSSSEETVLALAMDNGQVQFFSPLLGKVIRILEDSASPSSLGVSPVTTLPSASVGATGAAASASSKGVLGVAFSEKGSQTWTTSSDGIIRVYELAGSSSNVAVQPSRRILPDSKLGMHIASPSRDSLLVAHHSIKLLSSAVPQNSKPIETTEASQAHFTGHATPITHLAWLGTSRFVSAAEDDRTLYIWEVPESQQEGNQQGRPLALITLDSPARHVLPVQGETQSLLIVTSSGMALIYSIPTSFAEESAANASVDAADESMTAADAGDISRTEKKRQRRKRASMLAALPTLKPVSQVRLVLQGGGKKSGGDVVLPILDALAVQENGRVEVLLARLVRGAKLVLDSTIVREEASSSFIPQVDVARSGDSANLLVSLDSGGDTSLGGGVDSIQRYNTNAIAGADSSSATKTGAKSSKNAATAKAGGSVGAALSAQLGLEGSSLPTGAELDALIDQQADLGMDLDEPSLAQRLKSLQVQASGQKTSKAKKNGAVPGQLVDSDDEADEVERDVFSNKKLAIPAGPGGSTSLAQALTQALHSGDSALLTSCLVHGDPTLIRGTVARLSGPLAVRLLENCIERMSRGGSLTSKGALGSQRAKALVEWVRVTLIVHTGYFMSLPNLVTRLFHLHSALMARLASQDKLLELHGRLELVLAQIELRATYAAEHADVQGVKKGASKNRNKESKKSADERKQGSVWVESDAEDEEEDGEMDVDEDGLAEDVEAGEDDGEVQDIALGVGADEDEDEDEEDDSEDDEGLDEEEEDDEAMEVNHVEETPEPSEDDEGDAAGDDAEEEYDEDADEAGSLDDFVVDDDEEDFDGEGDSDNVDDEEDEDDEEDKPQKVTRKRSMLVDDEAEETSNEGTGPDEDSE